MSHEIAMLRAEMEKKQAAATEERMAVSCRMACEGNMRAHT
jgi:hypothetical protein